MNGTAARNSFQDNLSYKGTLIQFWELFTLIDKIGWSLFILVVTHFASHDNSGWEDTFVLFLNTPLNSVACENCTTATSLMYWKISNTDNVGI